MRTIIAGGRNITNYKILEKAISCIDWDISLVLSGNARGVDSLGENWASLNSIPLELYPANWKKYGKSAGPIRNELMANNADALLAIWDGKSRGTKNMIELAKEKGLKVYVHRIPSSN